MSGDQILGRLPIGGDLRTFPVVLTGDDLTDLCDLLEVTADHLDHITELHPDDAQWLITERVSGAARWREIAAHLRTQAPRWASDEDEGLR